MTKWDKIFTASSLFFLVGVCVFLLGEHLVPHWSQVTIPVGALVMGLSGIGAGVAGVVMLLARPART